MRILFLSHYFPPEGNAPASRTFENCRRWVRKGHDVTVGTCAPHHPNGIVYDGYENRWRHRERIEGIEVIRVLTHVAANKGTVRRILHYLSYLFSASMASLEVDSPDVIIATSPQFFCGWAGVIASRLHRVPLLLEIRDIWPESIAAVDAIRSGGVMRTLERLELEMYAASRHIVTVGEGYRRCLHDKGVPDNRISVVMNGIDREIFHPLSPDPELRRRIDVGDRFVVSYSGTIGMACGLDIVLRAADALRHKGRNDIVFLLVGDGAVREELQAEAERRSLDNVIFTGRQDKSLMPSFLAISGASLVHLKKTDLFTTVMPSKIFEAFGMARPIIIGVPGEAGDLVERAGAGVAIEPENAEQLVAAVEQLADDQALCERLGRAGHAYGIRHHDRDNLAEDYLQVISRVADVH
jgi:glycosyltransferase involved in cell wall biosynthesis